MTLLERYSIHFIQTLPEKGEEITLYSLYEPIVIQITESDKNITRK